MLAVVDSRIPEPMAQGLRSRGHVLCPLPPHPELPPPIASHPDVLLFFAPDRILCTPSYAKLARRELELIAERCGKRIQTTECEVGDAWPRDLLLDALPIGGRLFCHTAHTAHELTGAADYRVIHVRQGYAKCAAIPIGFGALITADPSIVSSATAEGLDVLQIEERNVILKGYDTGLIGGAASFAPYSEVDEIYFCGDLNRHPSADRIRAFCTRHGKMTISLSEDPLTDLGTVFLV